MPPLVFGDPAPWFTVPSNVNATYHFDTVAGYRVVLSCLGSSRLPGVETVLRQFWALQEQFAALTVPFFALLTDPADQRWAEQMQAQTYFKFLWDWDKTVSDRYGVWSPTAATDDLSSYAPTTYVLNERLQVVGVIPLTDAAQHVSAVMACLAQIPPLAPPVVASPQAPVLFIPNVFESAFCQHLIDRYEADGGSDSGFMRQIDGKTVEVLDHSFKKRRDLAIREPALLEQVNTLILRRVRPEIQKAFQFDITRFERHLVACYEATDQGFFNRHRDNTTRGTAHRRFAMSLNLNDAFEGGYLRFPEFGQQLYRPGPGEAVIFSCSLLHEATAVTAGRRFALLSFFYNDEDAQVREQNQQYVVLKRDQADSTARVTEERRDRPAAQSSNRAPGFGTTTKSSKKHR